MSGRAGLPPDLAALEPRDRSAWPDAARRELAAQLALRGVDDAAAPVAALAAAELAVARGREPRVTRDDVTRAFARAHDALSLAPPPARALFAFSRLLDAKLDFGPAELQALVRAGERDDDAGHLLAAIERGPPDGDVVWERPSSPRELVASVVRQLVLGDGSSRAIMLDPALAAWVERALAGAGAKLLFAMGGAGAFAANLASALPGVTARFFSRDLLPARIAGAFAPGVEIVTSSGEVTAPAGHAHDAPARINYVLEYSRDVPLPLDLAGARHERLRFRCPELDDLDEVLPLVATRGGRIILSTPEPFQAGFGDVADGALARVAREHDIFYFAGIHYFTKGAREDGVGSARRFADQLDVMKRAHPALVTHYQYVVPKVEENEAAVMAELAGHVDSVSLNSVEIAALLGRLAAAGLTTWEGDPTPTRDAAEAAAEIARCAACLLDALRVRRVHVHGYRGDLLLTRDNVDGDALVLAHLRSRQIACMKAANASGEIRTPADLWPVLPTVRGEGLAALYAFADHMRDAIATDEDEHARVVERWWTRDVERGHTWAFVPSRGIHDRTGGTVSLGDTIDATALLFAPR